MTETDFTKIFPTPEARGDGEYLADPTREAYLDTIRNGIPQNPADLPTTQRKLYERMLGEAVSGVLADQLPGRERKNHSEELVAKFPVKSGGWCLDKDAVVKDIQKGVAEAVMAASKKSR